MSERKSAEDQLADAVPELTNLYQELTGKKLPPQDLDSVPVGKLRDALQRAHDGESPDALVEELRA